MLFLCYRVICSTQQGRVKGIKINLHGGEHLGKAVSKLTIPLAEWDEEGSKAEGKGSAG